MVLPEVGESEEKTRDENLWVHVGMWTFASYVCFILRIVKV